MLAVICGVFKVFVIHVHVTAAFGGSDRFFFVFFCEGFVRYE